MSHNITAPFSTILRAVRDSLVYPNSIPIRLQTQAGILVISLVSIVDQAVVIQLQIDTLLDTTVTGNPQMSPEQESRLKQELDKVGISDGQAQQ